MIDMLYSSYNGSYGKDEGSVNVGLIIFVIVCFVGFIFIMFLLVGSIKNMKQKNRMIIASDGYYKSIKGSYTFEYMVKVFVENNKPVMKISIQPIFGLDALNNFGGNGYSYMNFDITHNPSKKVQNYIYDLSGEVTMLPNHVIKLDEGMYDGNIDYTVHVTSVWRVGTYVFNDEVTFKVGK